jgi:hypothetical protein
MKRYRPSRARLKHAWRAGREAYRAHRRRPRPDFWALIKHALRGEDGFIIAAVLVVTVAAAALSAYATYEQGQAQKKAYKYNAKVAENQAKIAQQQQDYAAKQQRERDRRAMAQARAAQGVSGVAVGEGSSLLVDIENAREAEKAAQAAKYTGQAQVSNILAGGELSRFQAGVAGRQGTIGAGATLLSGVAQAGGTYYTATARPTGVQTGGTNGIGYGHASTPPPGVGPW